VGEKKAFEGYCKLKSEMTRSNS